MKNHSSGEQDLGYLQSRTIPDTASTDIITLWQKICTICIYKIKNKSGFLPPWNICHSWSHSEPCTLNHLLFLWPFASCLPATWQTAQQTESGSHRVEAEISDMGVRFVKINKIHTHLHTAALTCPYQGKQPGPYASCGHGVVGVWRLPGTQLCPRSFAS